MLEFSIKRKETEEKPEIHWIFNVSFVDRENELMEFTEFLLYLLPALHPFLTQS